jgi:hypothetical protein
MTCIHKLKISVTEHTLTAELRNSKNTSIASDTFFFAQNNLSVDTESNSFNCEEQPVRVDEEDSEYTVTISQTKTDTTKELPDAFEITVTNSNEDILCEVHKDFFEVGIIRN